MDRFDESEATKQLAKIIYHRVMSMMKFTLNLEEFSYREQGRNDPRYKTFKQQLMANYYDNLRGMFKDIEDLGVIAKTPDDEDVKGGYRDTASGGSGYVNTEGFDEFLTGE